MNINAFCSLWNNHAVPTRRIAEAMGMTRQGVQYWAARLGLPSRAKLRRRKHDPALLAEMWAAGVSTSDIAQHFGLAHHACVSTAARCMGLPRRQRGPSGRMNGGWRPTITAAAFFEARLAQRMARSAREEQAAMIAAEMVDRREDNRPVGIDHARGVK